MILFYSGANADADDGKSESRHGVADDVMVTVVMMILFMIVVMMMMMMMR